MLNNLTNNGWVIFTYLCFAMLPCYGQGLASLPADFSPTNLQYQDEQTATLESLLIAYEKKYRVSIIFNSDEIGQQQVNKPADSSALDSSLQGLLDPIDLTFKKIDDKVYVVKQAKKRERSVKKVERSRTIFSANPPPTRVARLKAKVQPYETKVAQTIQGKVTGSDTNEPLPGVNILAKGTTIGTVTDVDGNYRLTVADEATTLVFSSIGYETVEEPISGRGIINLSLNPDIQALEEVVVVGYGTQTKGELTVSLSQVKGQELRDIPKTSLTEALGGRAAGVDVVTGSGAPGAGSKIRIRGANSINSSAEPLVVIDGFPVAASAGDLYEGSRMGVSGDRTDLLSMINPNDIESIEILKDAAATSIYGARGANGVILITTKNGRTGTSGISLNVNTGVQQIANEWELLNANQFSNLLYDAYQRGGIDMQNLAFDPSQELAIPVDYNTNWLDEVVRTGSLQDYNLTFSGSSDKSSYSGSVGYLDNQGIIKSNFYKRYSARFNADSRAWNDKIQFGLNTNLSYVDQKAISNNRVYNRAMQMAPNFPVRFPSGQFAGDYLTSDGVINAIDELWGNNYGVASSNALNLATPYLDIDVAQAPTNTARIIANGFISVEPIQGLVFKSSLGTDLNYTKMKFLIQNVGPFRPTGGSLEHKQNQTYSWLNENTLTYTVDVGRHSVTALLGQSGQRFYREGLGFAVEEADPGNILVGNNPFFVDGWYFDNGVEDRLTDTHKYAEVGEWTVASYFARLNYSYDNRYLLTATVRRDGSSKFGRDSKWGTFPGVSAAWNLHNENFFNVSSINQLKIRGSYGVVGNANIDNFQSQALLQRTPADIIGVVVAGTSAWEAGLVDPALSWESTRSIDVGFDALLLNRFNVTSDVYWKRTFDLLYGFALPYTSGFSRIQTTNLGSLRQFGVELSVSGDIIQRSDANGFNWFASLNMDHLRGEITELPPDILWVGDKIRSYLDQPIGTIYGYEVDGIYNTQEELDDPANPFSSAALGDYRYRDLGSTDENGNFINTADTSITAADRVNLGNVNPIINLGFNNTFTYKGFDLTLFFRGSFGNKIYNEARRELLDTRGERNTITDALNRWTPTNNSQTIQAANSNRIDPTGDNPISTFVEDGSYLRLQNLTFGYRLSQSVLDKIGIGSLRIYTSINNLFVLTNYSGLDPEVSGGDALVPRGIDNSLYPRTRLYSLGLNVAF